jgi:hypothetical protein
LYSNAEILIPRQLMKIIPHLGIFGIDNTLAPHHLLHQLIQLQKLLTHSPLVLQHPWWKLKRLQKTKKDPDNPEPAAEGDTQMEYSSD